MATKEPKKTNSVDAKNTKSVKSAAKKDADKTEAKTRAKKQCREET